MPKKSRKSRLKRKRAAGLQSPLKKEAGAAAQTPPSLPGQAYPAKPASRQNGQTYRYPYISADLRRIGITAGALMALLIILYYILR